ncbi:hypothetical protein V5799_023244 [Amblyomma americanum]|uniref:Uncharacterized protein n=1 Tax=Amblyomma americanum TaxID=6943 RepID=A0AAQ4FJQ0_AMBAM
MQSRNYFVSCERIMNKTLLFGAVTFLKRSTKTQKPVYYTFCFWDGLSRWRPAPQNFSVSDIPAELCSAVVYSHVTIDDKTGSIKLTEQELKLGKPSGLYSLKFDD